MGGRLMNRALRGGYIVRLVPVAAVLAGAFPAYGAGLVGDSDGTPALLPMMGGGQGAAVLPASAPGVMRIVQRHILLNSDDDGAPAPVMVDGMRLLSRDLGSVTSDRPAGPGNSVVPVADAAAAPEGSRAWDDSAAVRFQSGARYASPSDLFPAVSGWGRGNALWGDAFTGVGQATRRLEPFRRPLADRRDEPAAQSRQHGHRR